VLSGWAAGLRDHGGVLFMDLRDMYGVTQIVLHDTALYRGIGKETVVRVCGEVLARDADAVNPKLATGRVEVHAKELEALGPAAAPLPFPINGAEEVREDLRLRYRYLDLRGEHMQDVLKMRAAVLKRLRENMDRLGFLEVATPILTVSSPEGARDYLVPSRKYKGKFYALPQAPQQYKQLLMVSGVDKYYQIAPCFRDEDARGDRPPGEFYQLDFEMAFATQEDVFAVAETVLYDVFKTFGAGVCDTPPFPRIPFAQAILKYGTDKPDLRNPLVIEDLSAFFADVDFKPFQGKPVRGIKVPGGARQPRRFFEEMGKFAERIGMRGLGYVSVNEDGDAVLKGPIAKFLNEEKTCAFRESFSLRGADTVFFISDKAKIVDGLAGQIRTELGNMLGLIEAHCYKFCFITDFPLYEINEKTGKPDFLHNPFSMPQGGEAALAQENPLEILAYQYDVVVNGVELSSGAVRNHIPSIMEKAFALAGYAPEEVKRRFGALYNAFQYGAPPHAGMAPGIDRMMMVLRHETSIRETIAFPMNGAAQDLLMGAPGDVSPQQLRDVHIRVRE
jgi:aspartyl-tRNA synthetase